MEEYSTGQLSIHGLARAAGRLLDIIGEGIPGERRPGLISRSLRADSRITQEQVISALLTAEASRETSVGEFRDECLRGELLREADVADWVTRQAKLDGNPIVWLTIRVPSGHDIEAKGNVALPDPPITIDRHNPGILLQRFFLQFIVTSANGNGESEREIAVAEGGVLLRLRELSQSLSRTYGWGEAQATHFVLTGETPLVSSISYSTSVPSGFTTLARTTIHVDPAMSPREVAGIYRKARQSVVGKRHRELTEKHMRLAQFRATRPDGETLASMMREWNAEHREKPKWTYTRVTNFGRDSNQAIQRLLHPDYGPKISMAEPEGENDG